MFRLGLFPQQIDEWKKDTTGKITWYGQVHPDYKDGLRCRIGDTVFYVIN